MPQGAHHDQSARTSTSPPHAKRTLVRAHRPAPLGRKSTAGALGPNSGRQSKQAEKNDEGRPEMATSFLQYCATCEKQIEVPDNKILYCSERCRRRDSAKPILPMTPPMSSPSTPPPASSSIASTTREILPPLTPSSPISIPAYANHSKSDLDPTEWKPKLRRGRGATAASEAVAYLQQFHRATTDNLNASDEAASTSMPTRVSAAMSSRPRMAHHSTTSMSALLASMHLTSAAPSLANTPTTIASSLESNNGVEYVNHVYDFNTRPLPPRRNPLSFDGAKGVELVTPHAAPTDSTTKTIDPIADGKGIWEKKAVIKKGSADKVDREGLGALFK